MDRPADVVGMLHDLYAVYPGENHALLARALLQARKNTSPDASGEAIGHETGRLLGMMRSGSDTVKKRVSRTARS